MPKSPVLRPTRLPSIVEPNQSSWRLSFTSEHRGEQLRKLSQGSAFPVTVNVERLNEIAQPSRYLHDKGFRTSYQMISTPEDKTNLESYASHSQTCSASQDFGGTDGVGDGSGTTHLHNMRISQRLASSAKSSSSHKVSSLGSVGLSNIMHTERARYMQNTSDSTLLSDRIPQSWGKVVHGSASSVYHSVSDNHQHSRESSQLNLLNNQHKSVADVKGGKGLPHYNRS